MRRYVIALIGTVAGVVVVTAASCTAARQSAEGIAVDTVGARATIAQLEAAARAIAKTDGCNASPQCRTAPVGARPCGGPRTYLAYCAATTDTVALVRKLGELKAAEITFNQRAGLTGSCDFLMPPDVAVQGASCRTTSP